MEYLTADQVSAMVQGVKAQMDSDTMWLGKVVEALNEHGDMLDVQHQNIKQLTNIQEGIGAATQDLSHKYQELNQRTLDDDELIRASVNTNDTSMKEEINRNDIEVRKVIAAQDTVLKNALLDVNNKLEAAMSENAKITAEWSARVVQVEQHCSGSSTALEEIKNNVFQNVKAVAGLGGQLAELRAHVDRVPRAAEGSTAAAAAAAGDRMQQPENDPWNRGAAPGPRTAESRYAPAGTAGTVRGAARYHMEPSTNNGNGTHGKELKLYEEKVVMQPDRRYSEKEAVSWKTMTENYFIGRVPDMERFLQWIEEQGDKEIEFEDIKELPELLKGCTPEYYESKKEAMKENFELAKKYRLAELTIPSLL